MRHFTRQAFAAGLLMLALPVAAPTAAVAAGIGHTFVMRGSVVGMTDGTPTICIGKADGATVGQVLQVFRVTTGQGTKGTPTFRRQDVGSIRIKAIIDQHFATATVVKGEVAKNDIVELRPS